MPYYYIFGVEQKATWSGNNAREPWFDSNTRYTLVYTLTAMWGCSCARALVYVCVYVIFEMPSYCHCCCYRCGWNFIYMHKHHCHDYKTWSSWVYVCVCLGMLVLSSCKYKRQNIKYFVLCMLFASMLAHSPKNIPFQFRSWFSMVLIPVINYIWLTLVLSRIVFLNGHIFDFGFKSMPQTPRKSDRF